jgi:hypothetical protein
MIYKYATLDQSRGDGGLRGRLLAERNTVPFLHGRASFGGRIVGAYDVHARRWQKAAKAPGAVVVEHDISSVRRAPIEHVMASHYSAMHIFHGFHIRTS